MNPTPKTTMAYHQFWTHFNWELYILICKVKLNESNN